MGQVEDTIKKMLFASCCSIQVNGTTVGSGWAASDCCIISAGHLFEKIEDTAKITAHFVNKREYLLEIEKHKYRKVPLTDYAILRPLNGRMDVPPLKSSKLLNLSGRFFTCGYGKTMASLSHAEGYIVGYIEESNGITLLKLNSGQSGEFGYSGSPIYSMEVNAVIAIQSEATAQNDSAERDTIVAYPLQYFWQELSQALRKNSNEPNNDSLGLFDKAFATKLDRAIAYRRGGDQMCAEGQFSSALLYYEAAKKIFTTETGTASRYVRSIKTRIEDVIKKIGG